MSPKTFKENPFRQTRTRNVRFWSAAKAAQAGDANSAKPARTPQFLSSTTWCV